PAEASLGSKRRGSYPPPIHGVIGLESSSRGSSFPADSAKPVPLAVVSLDSRQGHSELGVRRSGKDPERVVPSPFPADTRWSALATLAAQAAHQQSTVCWIGVLQDLMRL
ncbi:unnamed protein product, partial [Brassica rapa subsp. trilocularis]